MKICIVSSVGGHLTEILSLRDRYKKFEHFYVLNKKVTPPKELKEDVLFIKHSQRDYKLFINFIEAFLIIFKKKPNLILSAGAGPAVPFSLVGKYLFGTKVIFIESMSSVKDPTLTGRIMYYFADIFIYQWEELKDFYPRGIYLGTLI